MDVLTGARARIPTIVATCPLLTLALNDARLKRERLSTRPGAGVALTVSGVVILLVRW